MSWAQICARYPERYVVVTDIERAEGARFDDFSARVIADHDDRRDAAPDIKEALEVYGSVACKLSRLRCRGFPRPRARPVE
jgi:hypothetical protein